MCKNKYSTCITQSANKQVLEYFQSTGLSNNTPVKFELSLVNWSERLFMAEETFLLKGQEIN